MAITAAVPRTRSASVRLNFKCTEIIIVLFAFYSLVIRIAYTFKLSTCRNALVDHFVCILCDFIKLTLERVKRLVEFTEFDSAAAAAAVDLGAHLLFGHVLS